MYFNDIEFQTPPALTEHYYKGESEPTASEPNEQIPLPGHAEITTPDVHSQMYRELYALEREIASTLRKCDQFRSAEVAWRDALGTTPVAALALQSEQLAEKLQAAEQDFLDNSDDHAAALQQIGEAIGKRQVDEQRNAKFMADRWQEIKSLKKQTADANYEMSWAMAAEEKLLTYNRHLVSQLIKPPLCSEPYQTLVQRKEEACLQLASARRAAASTSRTAAKAEADLLRARKDFSACENSRKWQEAATLLEETHQECLLPDTTECPKKNRIAKVCGSWAVWSDAAHFVKMHNARKLQEATAKASIWSDLCEKSQGLAKACQTKATRATLRLEAAERSAGEARKTLDEQKEAAEAAIAAVDVAKLDKKNAAKHQRMIIVATIIMACFTLMQVMGWQCQLLQEAPILICFFAGFLFMKMQKAGSSSMCWHSPMSKPSKCSAATDASSCSP